MIKCRIRFSACEMIMSLHMHHANYANEFNYIYIRLKIKPNSVRIRF